MNKLRLGIDVGGTKVELAAIDPSGKILFRRRVPNPGEYNGLLATIRDLADLAVAEVGIEENGRKIPLGVGIPGSTNKKDGLVKNANATWLNGKPFEHDLPEVTGRPVRVENDANCFALSEAIDGAAAGKSIVFGVIIGSGMGGGLVINGHLVTGLHHVAGEWGHTPLPWPRIDEFPMPKCFCGNEGCLERFLCGPALAADWKGAGNRSAEGIENAAADGDKAAQAALDRYVDRLARACSLIINLLDPDAIVLGGGVSNLRKTLARIPSLLPRHVITPECETLILPNLHGDSSGVRGAAWLWDAAESIS
ncbi:ROK family protein [Acetobacter oeni]|uniref:Fructokinase n=1 Tax=Acetobacter oeni TaxID=304077 RepID=A0A511XJN6_9PROT|nr:ROK family protein [Acetobacter oeni]MBB3883379.1 fructokinase [Acetobacter oeni]NHO19453.1 ROK family protein [Acetobacter oeni]GBR00678.1 fructokinase [Acetobacter oeni LMG 21952]GEN63163.1 fructokinase [Acetobacter oeni]